MKIKIPKYLKIIIIILLQTFFFNKAISEIIKKFIGPINKNDFEWTKTY